MIIYKITNKVTGKQYVGQTIGSVEKRLQGHIGSKFYLGRAIRKHGKENFKLEVIEKCNNIDELNKKESYWIEKLKTKAPHGYNIKDGGKNGRHSEATKRKMSEIQNLLIQKGRIVWSKGKKLSEEHKRKLSESHKGKKLSKNHKKSLSDSGQGRKVSIETRKKISKAHKGQNGHMFGKKRSEETKRKMSEAQKGKKLSKEHRKKISFSHMGKKFSTETKQKMALAAKNRTCK